MGWRAERAHLSEVVRDLLSLEINTILKENMTSEPMPPIPHALLDIAGRYSLKLRRLHVELGPFFDADEPQSVELRWADGRSRETPFDTDRLTVSVATFDRLRWAAKKASQHAAEAPVPVSASDGYVLMRICHNCDAIKGMMKRDVLKDLARNNLNRLDLVEHDEPLQKYNAIPIHDFVAIRKIWEIGVEEVVAQTVIQLNGDVVTRVRDWVREPGAEMLLTVHQQGVDVSVSSWRHLLGVVQSIAGTAVRGLLSR